MSRFKLRSCARSQHHRLMLAALCLITGCLDRATIGALLIDAGAGTSSTPLDAGAADSGDDACAPGAEPSPSNMPTLVVAMDNSASLLPWWGALSDGFMRFIQEDASRGMGVGLMSFAEACDPAEYLPPLVPIAALPDNLAALQAAAASVTSLTSSTIPVLNAALRYAKDWATAHPDARVSVLLITDASPGACDGLTGDYAAEAVRLASEAYAGTPSVTTFAVGGDGLDTIKPIAAAGGSEAVLIGTLSGGDAVLAALREIRSVAIPQRCRR